MKPTSVLVPHEELQRQREIMSAVRGAHPGGRAMIITYGCQMNAHDSEKIAGMLQQMGFAPTQQREEADVLLFNTCCVREGAERRVFGNVAALRAWKEKRPGRVIGVCGCMMQQEGAARELLRRNPFVDVCFGTHNLHTLPQMLQSALRGERVLQVEDVDGVIAEGLPLVRAGRTQAFVTVMYGCDNFCSYCIVPHVRGRQRSRAAREILREVEGLLAQGVLEVTLLGQNVNSYGQDGEGPSFAELLRSVAALGVPRIRFMTSHPKDCAPALLQAMADCQNVCPHLHLPVQAGSDRILSAMNRGYAAEEYLRLVRLARAVLPGIGLTSDIIVGFPGETDGDFQQTLQLVEAASFDGLYTFEYSKRSGTPAADMPGQVAEDVKTGRLMRLTALQKPVTAGILKEQVGSVQKVLLVERSARSDTAACGRTARGITVNVEGALHRLDAIADVRITAAKQGSLVGELSADG